MSLEGLPDVRSDFAFGQVCALIANVNRRDDSRTWSPEDFFPMLRAPEVEQESVTTPPPDPEQHSRLISALLSRATSKP